MPNPNNPFIPGTLKATVTPMIQNVSWNKNQGGYPTSPIAISVEKTGMMDIDTIEWQINFQNNAGGWLVSDNDNLSGFLDWNGSFGILPLDWKDLDLLLSNTNYKAVITFNCLNIDNIIGKVYTADINLNIIGTSPTAIQTDKSNYNVVFDRANNALTGDLQVNIINNSNGEILQMMSIGDYFNPQSSATQFSLVQSTNNPFSTNPLIPQEGVKTIACKLYNTSGIVVASFTVTLTVFFTTEIIIEPPILDLKLRKGLNEVDSSGIFQVHNFLQKNYTITTPYWFTLPNNTSNLPLKLYNGTSVNSENIAIGNYSGLVTVNYDNQSKSIPINLKVFSFVEFEFMGYYDYFFALDGVPIAINQMENNGKFVKIKMKITNCTDLGISEVATEYVVPYYNGRVEVDLGGKIQNYFPIYKKELLHLAVGVQNKFDNKFVYNPSRIDIVVEELDDNFTVLHSTTLNSFDVFPGRRPKLFPLMTNHEVRRRYKDTPLIFSYYCYGVEPSNFINQTLPNNSYTEDDINTVIIYNDNIINKSGLVNNFALKLVDFPKVENKIMLQWLNNNLVPEWLVLSGNFKINSEYTHTTDKQSGKYEKFDTEKVSKISVFTGFLLSEEVALLDEVAKSPLSFIKVKNKIYTCYCTQTKLVEEDLDRELANYELEFQIKKV